MRRKDYRGRFLTASFGKRLIAYFIDWILIFFFSRFIISIFSLILPETFYYQTTVFTMINALIYFGYFVLMTKVTNGQTVGKMITRIRIVSEVEEELSWTTVLVRELAGKFVLRKWKIFYLLIFFSSKNQHPFDMLAETIVLDEILEVEFLKYENLDRNKLREQEVVLEY